MTELFRRKIQVRQQALKPTPAEIDAYRNLQRALPVGATVLCSLPRNYLLDFARNRVFVNDLPGIYGPGPGWPNEHGGAGMARYLRQNGVEYVAVQLADPLAGAPHNRWDTIVRANRLMRARLAERTFATSVVYECDRFRVYRVPE